MGFFNILFILAYLRITFRISHWVYPRRHRREKCCTIFEKLGLQKKPLSPSERSGGNTTIMLSGLRNRNDRLFAYQYYPPDFPLAISPDFPLDFPLDFPPDFPLDFPPDFPPCLGPSLGPCLGPCFPPDFPLDFPSDFPLDFPPDFPLDFPSDFPLDFPSDFPSDFPPEPPFL
jgi:hypothetical protein